MMLGHVLKMAGRLGEAAAAFRRAVQLGPRSRLSSLGLFHSLYNAGRRWEAFAEIKRRLDIKPLDDYVEFLNGMSPEDLDLLEERGLLPTGWHRGRGL